MSLDQTLDPDDLAAEWDQHARESRARRTRRARLGTLGEARHLAAAPAGRALLGACAAIAALTVVGLVALWPHGEQRRGPSQALGGPTVAASVAGVRDVPCQGPTPQRCRQLVVRAGGRQSPLTLGPVSAAPSVGKGDAIRVARAQGGGEPYTFVGFDRQGSLLWMALALGLLAVILLRWRGILAVVGVGISLLLLTTFLVPAILQGRPAIVAALVAALAVMFLTLVLTSGLGAQTLAAAVGVTLTLLLTCGLAELCVALARLDGRSNELSLFLSQENTGLSLRGVVLAGMIVGALGVLADTAVTQASAVMALRRANQRLDARGLYRDALAVGRDHLSATIHTLVLAYAGAALPLLLVMRSTRVSASDALNAQDIAEPVVATIVGCVALIAAVPLTTALASMLAARVPTELLPEHAHHHHHHHH